MNVNIGYVVAVFVVAIFSIILHELAHGIVAYCLGDKTAKYSGRLTLNPLKHIDPFMSIILPAVLALIGAPILGGAKPVPINTRNLKWREFGFALVAIAGPLTNLILAFTFFMIGHFTGAFYVEGLGGIICQAGMFTNMGFALFNIIPIPPLDGSRVLYALAPESVQNFLRSMEQYGFIVIYMLMLLCGSMLSRYFIAGENGLLDFFYFLVGVR